MANRNRGNQTRKNERTYKGKQSPSVAINKPGDSFTGAFQDAKEIEITDSRTKEVKWVMRYLFRDKDGNKMAILGRAMLDAAFDDVFEREGGMEKCQGLMMEVRRGDDSKLSGGRTMGNYEIAVWEE